MASPFVTNTHKTWRRDITTTYIDYYVFNILNLLSNWMLNSHFILIRLHLFLYTDWYTMCAYGESTPLAARDWNTYRLPHGLQFAHTHTFIQMTHSIAEYKFRMRQHLVLKMLMPYFLQFTLFFFHFISFLFGFLLALVH